MHVSCLRYLKAGARNAASKTGVFTNKIKSPFSTRKFPVVPVEINFNRLIGNCYRGRDHSSFKFVAQRRCLSNVPVSQ